MPMELSVNMPRNCAAGICREPGVHQWIGATNGGGLALVALTVTWWFCDEHDEWHRNEALARTFAGQPLQPRGAS